MEHDECNNCSVPGLGGAMQFISTTNFFEKNLCQLIKKIAGNVKSSVLTK